MTSDSRCRSQRWILCQTPLTSILVFSILDASTFWSESSPMPLFSLYKGCCNHYKEESIVDCIKEFGKMTKKGLKFRQRRKFFGKRESSALPKWCDLIPPLCTVCCFSRSIMKLSSFSVHLRLVKFDGKRIRQCKQRIAVSLGGFHLAFEGNCS